MCGVLGNATDSPQSKSTYGLYIVPLYELCSVKGVEACLYHELSSIP